MKNFLIIWVGELVSSIGSGMTAFALSIYVYQLTGSVTYVSLITLLAFMPTVLLSPLGGILADRYDRRLLMICGDVFSGLGVLYILFNLKMGNQGILPILIGVSISSIFVSLMEPAYRATVSDLLTQEEYGKASGMVQMAGNAKYLISPALAGLLLHISDISLILALDFGTFIITVTSIFIARSHMQKPMKKETKSSLKKEFQEGFQVVSKNKEIRSLIMIMTLVCFFLGFIQTLTAPMILAVSDAKTVGYIESFCAAGMLVSSIFIGIFGIKNNGYRKILMISAVLCGLFMALVGVKTNLYFVSLMLFMFFLTIPFINSCAEVLLRSNIPNELQGRVWGLVSLLTQTGMIIAFASCGVIADAVFEPMFQDSGFLTNSIGRIIGIGQGRGIGFMLILSGIGMILSMFVLGRSRGSKTINIEPKQ
ncbi:MFS transporter [Anaerotignum sp.]|uniref:MFS transporter n=1 Tax=Anaerotignum sp. TaxID=2039241 RepID=UPI00289C9316|nr:MFS transporter [Anaerotignum sp.]